MNKNHQEPDRVGPFWLIISIIFFVLALGFLVALINEINS